MSGLVKD